jgi:hypothetical protein
MSMNFEQAEMWRRLSDAPGNYYTQASESEREDFRKFVEEQLHLGRITVEFTKADGSVRAMICTLSEDHGAKYNPVTESANLQPTQPRRRPTMEVRTVWDCEAGAWRSFRWDRLNLIGFTIG